jgi:hypothetical protein
MLHEINIYKSGEKKRRKVVEATGGETAARKNMQYVEWEREDKGDSIPRYFI